MNEQIKPCPRCSKECVAKISGNQSARPLRKSNDGLCLECATTSVFLSLPAAKMVSPSALLLPHIREQFCAVLRAGESDLETHGVDWQRVVDNWDLPFPKKHRPVEV